jgi:hypothetical protein
MASKDKTLGRVSDWSTLIMMAGIAALGLLPGNKLDHAPTKAPPRLAARAVAPTPAPEAPPRVATPAIAPTPAPDATHVSQPAPPTVGPAAEPVEDVWTDAELAAGLRECVRLLAPIAAEIALEEPIKRGQCGTPAPLLLRSAGAVAKVKLDPAPMMNCRLAAQLTRWVDTVLQPAAREVLGSPITRIVGASSYACRNIYNRPEGPLSEHAKGNAVDIAAFVTADGRKISVAKGWGPTERDIAEAQRKIAEAAEAAKAAATKQKDAKKPREDADPSIETAAKKSRAKEQGNVHKAGFKSDPPAVTVTASVKAATTSESVFLKRLHREACGVFGTVLGPEANEAHRDHFHLDAKERKRHAVCH